MDRRGPARLSAVLVAMVAGLLVATVAPGGAHSPPVAVASAPADDVSPAPSDTVTDFYPENSNLSECVGLVEKPGCGSDSRGGWRQTLVFVVLFAGLGAILWRVSRGIKANRAAIDSAAPGRTQDSGDRRRDG